MEIHITSEQVKSVLVREYSKELGIFAAPIYWLPTYKMTVEGVGPFEVIRVGLNRSQVEHPKDTRTCNVGVFHAQTVTDPAWDNNYSPVTREGTIRGGLRLWPLVKEKMHFLIHEGPGDRLHAMGTAGCIEVVGEPNWKQFVDKVKPQALKRKVMVVFDELTQPEATLAIKDPGMKNIWAPALYDKWKNNTSSDIELTDDEVRQLIRATKVNDGSIKPQALDDLYLIALNYVANDQKKVIDELVKYLNHHGKHVKKT
jgi:hypothetical protein